MASMDDGDPWQDIRKALEPYIRPREEVAYIKRVLALHLDSCIRDGSACTPLALVESSQPVSRSPEARGLHEEYLKALNANIAARSEYSRVLTATSRSRESQDSAPPLLKTTPSPLEQHLVGIRLRRKQQKLRVLEKYLDLLDQKSASAPGFLDPDSVFADFRSPPAVPKEVVDEFVLRDAPGEPGLRPLIGQLEKRALRAKLQLEKEEQQLKDAKSRSTAKPEAISLEAKLRALSTTRDELISWIETELSQTPGGNPPGSGDGQGREEGEQGTQDGVGIEERLVGAKEKYAQYIVARKSLLQLAAQQQQQQQQQQQETQSRSSPKPGTPEPTSHFTGETTAATAHLLTPYLEKLLSVSREQKGLIGEKSHLNVTIAKQLKETCQILDHLADESHLLPGHPMPGSSRPNLGFRENLVASESLDSLSRVKPWVFAADSAKIATLEAVAEKIEEGQVALEGSIQALDEIDQLLGCQKPVGQDDNSQKADAAAVDDIWLAEGEPSGKQGSVSRKHAGKGGKGGDTDDIWSILDGSLGLLKSENEIP